MFTLIGSGISLLVILRTATMAAWSVAQEKEARSWAVLLCTPLPDIWILRHKALSVVMRNAVGWMALMTANFVFLIHLMLHEKSGGFGMGMYVLSSFVGTFSSLYMVTGTGLYFSIRMRTGALAVIATLGFLIGFHVVLRFLMIPVVLALGPMASKLPYVFVILNPLISVVIGVLMFKLCGKALRRFIF